MRDETRRLYTALKEVVAGRSLALMVVAGPPAWATPALLSRAGGALSFDAIASLTLEPLDACRSTLDTLPSEGDLTSITTPGLPAAG